MWRLRQHLLTHKTGSKPNIVAQQSRTSQNVQMLLQASSHPSTPPRRPTPAATSSDDHPYATASDPLQVTPERHSAVPATAQSDHLYSTTKAKQDNREVETQQELQVRLKKIDHLYSSPSSPSSAANIASTKGKKVKKQSIQALGHSYAAARPRRVSLTEAKKRTAPRSSDSSMFPCQQCDKEFELPHRLTRHVREVHSAGHMFPCDRCDKEFAQPYRLNRHIREVHIKEKLHACAYCDKAFFKVTSKERHELTHTEHQLWKCSSCSKCFRDPSSLKYHEAKSVCLKKSQKT